MPNSRFSRDNFLFDVLFIIIRVKFSEWGWFPPLWSSTLCSPEQTLLAPGTRRAWPLHEEEGGPWAVSMFMSVNSWRELTLEQWPEQTLPLHAHTHSLEQHASSGRSAAGLRQQLHRWGTQDSAESQPWLGPQLTVKAAPLAVFLKAHESVLLGTAASVATPTAPDMDKTELVVPEGSTRATRGWFQVPP